MQTQEGKFHPILSVYSGFVYACPFAGLQKTKTVKITNLQIMVSSHPSEGFPLRAVEILHGRVSFWNRTVRL